MNNIQEENIKFVNLQGKSIKVLKKQKKNVLLITIKERKN